MSMRYILCRMQSVYYTGNNLNTQIYCVINEVWKHSIAA
jgi:hypothetical protein